MIWPQVGLQLLMLSFYYRNDLENVYFWVAEQVCWELKQILGCEVSLLGFTGFIIKNIEKMTMLCWLLNSSVFRMCDIFIVSY